MGKKYPRTEKDFVIDSIKGLKDIINRHTVAGFEDVSDAILFRRFYQLIKFLQDDNLTTKTLYYNQFEIDLTSELKNSDLNDKGFYFLQYALPKWEDRLYKDQREQKELKFIDKWYQTFLDKSSDLANSA